MFELGNRPIEMRDPSELFPNIWNPNSVGAENMEKIKTSLTNNGFFKPVLVRELEDGKLEIIGGKHRVEAASELGIRVPTLNLGKVDELTAKKLTLMDNDSYGQNDTTLVAKILRELEEGDVDVVGELTYSEKELSDLLNLTVDVNFDELDDLGSLDMPPEVPDHDKSLSSDDTDPKTYKKIVLKVDIEDAEFFDDLMREEFEKRGIEDSDMAVVRGETVFAILKELDANG